MASNLRYKPPGVQDPGAGSVALSGYPGFGFPPVTIEDVIVASVMWGFFTVGTAPLAQTQRGEGAGPLDWWIWS